MWDFLKNRLREPSTWVGIITTVATVAHFAVTDGQVQAIATAATAVVGVVIMFIPDRKP